MDQARGIRQAEKGAWISILSYIVLSSLKLVMAFIGDSEALRADGLNNLTDIISSIAVLIGLKISRKPADDVHRYGHYRAEYISSLIASFIMAGVGIQIILDAGSAILTSKTTNPDMLTAWTALFSAVSMYFVYRYNKKLAIQVSSSALTAAAQDNKSDAIVSVGTFIGILGSQLGIAWLDVAFAFIVGLIICKTAFDIFRESSLTLTDGFENGKLEPIQDTIQETEGVIDIKDLKARSYGNKIYIETTILVEPTLTVIESHKISEDVEQNISSSYKNAVVHIHIEPYIQEK